jgi:UPF0271 protein
MPFINIANVTCGFHAADPMVVRKTVRLAKQHGVKVGAHLSFPDLQGFGRREMKMGRDELFACMIYQVGPLKAFLDAEQMPLNHIKPHGALYGAAGRDPEVLMPSRMPSKFSAFQCSAWPILTTKVSTRHGD